MPTDSIVSHGRSRRLPEAAEPSSRRSRGRCGRSLVLAGLLAQVLLVGGCLSRPAVVTDDLLEPIGPPTPWLPRAADLDAARLAREALSAESRSAGSVAESVEIAAERLRESAEEADRKDLGLLGLDVRNATLGDPIADREATRALRRQGGLDPRLQSRLDRLIADDPLRLARRRRFDDWHRLWARTFNTLSEPLGSAAITGFALAPFQLANSIVHYLAEFSNSEPLSVTQRQALALRKQFLAAHPDTEWTEELREKVARSQVLLEETLALRRTRAAERALESDRPAIAARHAAAAIEALAPHPDENGGLRRRARRAAEVADRRLARIDRLEARSLESEPTPTALLDAERRIAARLLSEPARFDRLEPLLEDYVERGGGRDRSEYVRALAQDEAGFGGEARRTLAALGRRRDEEASMARHARALIEDDWQNPLGAFDRLKRKARREELAWRLAGEWVDRPRYPNLPAPLAYLIDAPTIAITIVLAPVRSVFSPWTGVPDFERAAALAAYRYLQREPQGEAQREVLDWLYAYESDRERWGRALRLADLMPRFDPEEREALVEKTAAARLANLDRLDRRDTRSSLLKGVAREFPDSEKGREAGLRAREELEDASAQYIRITREFLQENPDVAFDRGIGLSPRLLNEDPGDGELHPEGVVLRGGRILEIRLVAEGGDDDAPPESRIRQISEARLSRTASALDEAVQRNSLIDVDAGQDPDANRDVYLERARLGLTDDPDGRATAESSFVYRSLRERYGMVRGRESLLPFDLVFRGNLGDFTLGAFPRWRPPKETPDAFLYR